MNREDIKNVLDRSNVSAKDEIEILETIDALINSEEEALERASDYAHTIIDLQNKFDREIEFKEKTLKYQKDRIDKAIEEIKELRHWVVNNKHNENTDEHYLVVYYGTLIYKLNNLDILRGNDDK